MSAPLPKTSKTSFVLSLVLGTLAFVILTSGAFIIDHSFYEWLAAHRSVHMGIIHACIGMAALLSVYTVSNNPESFKRILPVFLLSQFSKLSPWISVGILTLVYFIFQFLALSTLHMGLGTSLWDFGFNDTIIWSTAHGKFLFLSVRGGQNALGEHFTPIFILLAPIYWISNSVFALFLLQTLIISCCIALVYLIARKIGVTHVSALCLAAAAFFYLPMKNGILHSFEAQTFADPFLLLGFFLILQKRRFWAVLSFVVAMMSKENIVMEVAGIGLFLIAQRQRIGWGILVLGVATFAFITFWIEPRYTFETNWYKWGYYSHIIRPSSETWNMWFKTILDFKLVQYLIFIFAPFALLPLQAPAWFLLFGPPLGMRLLSNFEGFRIITAHYTSGLNALVFIAAAYGMLHWNKGIYGKTIRKIYQALRLPSPNSLVCSGLIFLSFLFAGIPQLFILERNLWEASNPDNQRIVKMLREVPAEVSAVSTETLLAQMTHRHYLFSFTSVLPNSPLESFAKNADLLVVDRGRIYEGESQSLQDYESRGYQKVYEYSYMSLWANPKRINSEDLNQLIARWKQIESEKDIPYRKKTRHYYKIAASALGIVYIFAAFMLSRRERSQTAAGV